MLSSLSIALLMLISLVIPRTMTGDESNVPESIRDFDAILPHASTFAPGDLISIAWKLVHRRDAEIFDMLDQYVLIDDGERDMRVFILLRYLFQPKGGFDVNLGRQVPEVHGAETLPDYPLLIVDGIPLLLADDFAGDGKPTQVKVMIKYYRESIAQRRPFAPNIAADRNVVYRDAITALGGQGIGSPDVLGALFNKQLERTLPNKAPSPP